MESKVRPDTVSFRNNSAEGLSILAVGPLELPAPSNEETTAGTPSTNAKISLAEVAPELYYQLRRYPKFYGDDNTIHGGLLERSYLPSNYRIIAGYSNKDIPRFDIDPGDVISGIIGVVPVAEKSNNYVFLLNFDQYLWVKDGSPDAKRKHLPPVGIGIFGRARWAPKDRNVIYQFYSFGIGGYGMIIPGRDDDQWGIGWSSTHISSDLRHNLGLLDIDLKPSCLCTSLFRCLPWP